MTKVKNLGHIVLRVNDIERSEAFYTQILGLRIRYKRPGNMVFLTARDGISHELALFPKSSEQNCGSQAPGIGLAHIGWAVHDFESLQSFVDFLISKNIPIIGSKDHGIALGIYFYDPDGNEIEIYCELPEEEWPEGPELPESSFPHTLKFQ